MSANRNQNTTPARPNDQQQRSPPTAAEVENIIPAVPNYRDHGVIEEAQMTVSPQSDADMEDKENDVDMVEVRQIHNARPRNTFSHADGQAPGLPSRQEEGLPNFISNISTEDNATVPTSEFFPYTPEDALLLQNNSPKNAKGRVQPKQLKNGNYGEKMETDHDPSKDADEDEDRYKPEGSLTLKIDRFSEFARAATPESQQRLSTPVYIRGLPWKILAIPRDAGRGPVDRRQSKALGFFLQCNGEANDTTWNCTASATLRILSQKEGVDDNMRKISHNFYAKENDWGYSQFVQCDSLLDPNSGYIKDDTVLLQVEVSADAPHGVHWDSKKHAGHIGLKNQGATCYMNSILQTLFFTNKLRKAVYMMPTEDDDPECSVAVAMQRVFYELQFSDTPVGTKKLTKSFGWDSVDSFLQHDVQELCRVLLDNLESKMKSTVVADTIPSLFKGKMKSYIKCKNVDFESSREEFYYDVQLNVKGKADIMESFRDYTEPEVLDGDNKYDAGEHGMQPAEKGVKFLSFPPVLHLQLMRFQYDPSLDANVKINDRFQFPLELKLNEFVDEHGVEDDYTYLLHAVLVHSGDFHGGHYVVFINTNLKGNTRWCKFDDDVVSRATVRDAVNANFGGEDPDMVCRSYTNAYMLVYVKKSAVGDALAPVSEEDIPNHLKFRFENEKKKDVQRKKEKEEASYYCEIMLVTDEAMKVHNGFELFDTKALEGNPNSKLKVEKSMSIKDLYKFVANNVGYKENEFRLWNFSESADRNKRDFHHYQHETSRPRGLLRYESNELGNHHGFNSSDLLDNDHTLYLELGRLNKTTKKIELPHLEHENEFLCFLKFFNHERKVVEYKGPIFLNSDKDLASHLPEIAERLGLPVDTHLNLYAELRPESIVALKQMRALVRDERHLSEDGSIMVAEVADKVSPTCNASLYFKELYNSIEVEAHVNVDGLGTPSNSPAPPIKGKIGLDWPLNRVCKWVGKEIDCDPEKILLWKVSQHNEKPTVYLSENYTTYLAKDMLSLSSPNTYDPRAGKCYKLFYSKLPIKVVDLEHRHHVRLQALYDKFQITEIALFPEKGGNVQSLLDEAKKVFKFSPTGTKELRLVHVGIGANCMRVFQVFPKEQLINDIYMRYSTSILRVEEVPEDQLELSEGEMLFPVAHFDKEPSRMFGVPFFIKVTNNEKISNIRRKIKDILEVPDREFEKYKFSIVMSARIVRELENDENAVVNLSEIGHTHITSPTVGPFLGIDHMNKSRGMRGGHTTEKPIIIHN